MVLTNQQRVICARAGHSAEEMDDPLVVFRDSGLFCQPCGKWVAGWHITCDAHKAKLEIHNAGLREMQRQQKGGKHGKGKDGDGKGGGAKGGMDGKGGRHGKGDGKGGMDGEGGANNGMGGNGDGVNSGVDGKGGGDNNGMGGDGGGVNSGVDGKGGGDNNGAGTRNRVASAAAFGGKAMTDWQQELESKSEDWMAGYRAGMAWSLWAVMQMMPPDPSLMMPPVVPSMAPGLTAQNFAIHTPVDHMSQSQQSSGTTCDLTDTVIIHAATEHPSSHQ